MSRRTNCNRCGRRVPGWSCAVLRAVNSLTECCRTYVATKRFKALLALPGRKCEFLNEWRILIEVAVADPSRTNHEVDDAGPAKTGRAVRPRLKVNFLAALECCS